MLLKPYCFRIALFRHIFSIRCSITWLATCSLLVFPFSGTLQAYNFTDSSYSMFSLSFTSIVNFSPSLYGFCLGIHPAMPLILKTSYGCFTQHDKTTTTNPSNDIKIRVHSTLLFKSFSPSQNIVLRSNS